MHGKLLTWKERIMKNRYGEDVPSYRWNSSVKGLPVYKQRKNWNP